MRQCIFYVTLLALLSCARPHKPDPVLIEGVPMCLEPALPRTSDLCGDMQFGSLFTMDLHPCAICKTQQGCMDGDTFVYCVRRPLDPNLDPCEAEERCRMVLQFEKEGQ